MISRALQLWTLLYMVSCPLSNYCLIMLDRRNVRFRGEDELITYWIKLRSDKSLANVQERELSLQEIT